MFIICYCYVNCNISPETFCPMRYQNHFHKTKNCSFILNFYLSIFFFDLSFPKIGIPFLKARTCSFYPFPVPFFRSNYFFGQFAEKQDLLNKGEVGRNLDGQSLFWTIKDCRREGSGNRSFIEIKMTPKWCNAVVDCLATKFQNNGI